MSSSIGERLPKEVERNEEDLETAPISFRTEENLIDFICKSESGRKFWKKGLNDKIKREKEAWNLLQLNLGKINKIILIKILNLIDRSGAYGRSRIFTDSDGKLNTWANYLINGEEPEPVRIEKCLDDPNYKLYGVGIGLVTLILYLKDPISFNVMKDTTIEGLERLGRFDSKKGKRRWRDYYNDYNIAAKEFTNRFNLVPQYVDWVLAKISFHGVQKKEDGCFIGYWDNDEKAVKDLEKDFVHATKELIEKALDELGKTKASKNELLPKLREIIGRDGKTLVDDEIAWEEIRELTD